MAWIIVAVSSLMAPITSCGSIVPIISISSICCPAASSFKYLPSSLLHPGSSSRTVLITLFALFTKLLAVSASQGFSRNAKSRWCLRWKVTWHPGIASTSSSSFSLYPNSSIWEAMLHTLLKMGSRLILMPQSEQILSLVGEIWSVCVKYPPHWHCKEEKWLPSSVGSEHLKSNSVVVNLQMHPAILHFGFEYFSKYAIGKPPLLYENSHIHNSLLAPRIGPL